ncbi:hypothetical protein BYT27DRAFT_6781660, partial [Phlegmacium glaucopus]
MNPGFLLPKERKLLHHFMMLHQDGFAWNDSKRGHFREDFFPPVDILIGIRNLVVEVDAKYIKGMLANPDVTASASMNRWIVSILMFHFTLVHVPGSHHGPDGLSRRRPQPGDKDEPEDDFEDWIDQVNGFMHFINPSPSSPTQRSSITSSPPISCYITDSTRSYLVDTKADPPRELPTPYTNIPRSEAASRSDCRLIHVQHWLKTLERPPDISDSEYKSFMRYCTEFFIAGETDRLWRKDPKGAHKIVIPLDRRLFLISAAHNDVGHHGFYATNALLSEQYWWPCLAQ